MADIIVLGAGLNGLSTAILLARDGHEVTVVERDPSEPHGSADALWAAWERRGVPQFHLPHFLMPRWRALAERELPTLLDELVALGALRTNLVSALPARLGGGHRDGDERFATVTARRPVVEAALAAVAARTRGVTVRRGVAVVGLVAAPSGARVPRVAGVMTDRWDTLRADLVVDATGRRSPVPMMLPAIGARPPLETCDDSGFVYYGRHFRTLDGSVPEPGATLLEHFDSVSVVTLPCDNDTWAVVLVTAAGDRPLRELRSPVAWQAALDRYPTARAWGRGEPLTDVQVMAAIEDRSRSYVVDGAPVVTGLVAVGDSWACTNPSLGRGASIGLLHAVTLRDVLREADPTDAADHPEVLVSRFDEATEATVAPWHRATVAFDRHRLAEMAGDASGRPYEPEDPAWAIAKAMDAAKFRSPEVLRARAQIAGVLAPPEEVLAEPGLFDRIVAAADAPRYGLPGPTRGELLAVVAGSR